MSAWQLWRYAWTQQHYKKGNHYAATTDATMLFFLTSRIISSLVAFLYPCYASYKTLSQRPASEAELERWLMYWSVLGCIVGVEYIAEWVISWIPFYYTFKMIFLLYLALPQTQGSSYLYTVHLNPFLRAHERQIDAALIKLKARAYSFIQEKLRALWDMAMASLGQPTTTRQDEAAAHSAQPPTMNDPASGPMQLVGSFWRSYGPAVMAGGAALMQKVNAGAAAAQNQARAQTWTAAQNENNGVQMPTPSIGSRSSSSSSGSAVGGDNHGLRERERKPSNASAFGRFEEVDPPSDVEGYDVGGHTDSSGRKTKEAAGATPGSAGWFGGWGSKGGYEHVKAE